MKKIRGDGDNDNVWKEYEWRVEYEGNGENDNVWKWIWENGRVWREWR